MKQLRDRLLKLTDSLKVLILESRIVRTLLIWSKRIVIPGFDGVALY